MDRITLKQLRYFDAAARYGHFGHAADACAISQPALSLQIKELEDQLGVRLFDRTARMVRLTSSGEALSAHARDILNAVEDLSALARMVDGPSLSRLRLGIIPTIAPYLLPELLRGIDQSYPSMELSIRETITPTLLEEISAARLDAAIVALPISESTLAEAPLFEEEFVLVRPIGDANKPVPSGEALAKMRLLLLEEGHCFRDQALSFCQVQSSMARGGLEGSSLTTLVQMVGAGMGLTLLPQMAVAVETKAASVSVANFSTPKPTRSVGMIWRKSNALAPKLEDFAKVIRALLVG